MSLIDWPPPTTKPKQRDHVDLVIKVLRMALRDARWDLVEEAIVGLQVLRPQMHNRSPVRRPRISGTPMTPAMRREIRDLYRADPGRSEQDIAVSKNISIGRVSETIRGKRT